MFLPTNLLTSVSNKNSNSIMPSNKGFNQHYKSLEKSKNLITDNPLNQC